MFHAAYDSVYNHPGVAWVATLAFVVALLSKRASPFFFAALLVFAVEISCDAFFTSPTLPKSIEANKGFATGLEILFVILGDYRYFVFVERFARAKSAPPSAFGSAIPWLLAVPWAFVVPLTWTAIYLTKVIDMQSDQVKFLVYELLFIGLAAVLRFVVVPLRVEKRETYVGRYLLRLTSFELVQYMLWALADIVILGGTQEPGYALRIVPNVMYYGAFLFFAWTTAPKELRSQTPAP